jgi:transcriptional antiterminator RfaH
MWFVCRTKTQREAFAKSNLELRRLTVFLPRIIELGYEETETPKRRPSPLFPGYLFVQMQFPVDYYRVIWTPGVRDLVSAGGGPVALADEVIDGIRLRCDMSGTLRVPPAPWTPGDRVEIPEGPFEGLLATVVRVMPRRRRIKLLIEFLARQTSVEMPLSVLRAPQGASLRSMPAAGSVPARS